MRLSPILLLLVAACLACGGWYVVRSHEMSQLRALHIEQDQLNQEAQEVVQTAQHNNNLEQELAQLRKQP